MAPALQAFNRRWHAATDDFVFPSLFGVLCHLVLLILMACGLAWLSSDKTPDCPNTVSIQQYQAYLGGLVGMDAIQLMLLGWLLQASTQGSILDAHLRTHVPSAVHSMVFFYVLLFGLNTYGTQLYFVNNRSQCMILDDAAGFSARSLFLLAVFGHWFVIAVILMIFLLGFNLFDDHEDVKSWERRCTCLGRVFCCIPPAPRQAHRFTTRRRFGMKWLDRNLSPQATPEPVRAGDDLEDQLVDLADTRQLAPLATLAAVFAYFYGNMDLTLSDIATGLMLVGLQQKFEHKRNKQLQQQQQRDVQMPPPPAAPAGAVTTGSHTPQPAPHIQGPSSTPSTVATDDALLTGCEEGRTPPPGSSPAGWPDSALDALKLVEDVQPGPVPYSTLIDADHYFKYAMAAYGWAMYVFMSTRLQPIKCCQLIPGCWGCCTKHRRHPAIQESRTFSRSFTMEAVRILTEQDPRKCLLAMCDKNRVAGLLPYQINVEPMRKQIIIAVRGSMSQRDVVTDLVCEPVQVPHSWLSGSSELTRRVRKLQEHGPTLVPPQHHTISLTADARSAGQAALQAAAVPTHAASCPIPVNVSASIPADSSFGTYPQEFGSLGSSPALNDGNPKAASACQSQGGSARHVLPPEETCMVHRGMLASAREVLEDIHKKGVLAAVLGGDVQELVKLTVEQQQLLNELGIGPCSAAAAAASAHVSPGHPVGAGGSPTSQSARAGSDSIPARLPFKQISSKKAQEWEVVVVGHSLGAGVAALLAVHLRNGLPHNNVSCWAFSPPGGLLSPELSHMMQEYCTSVVIGKDMIPRLSFSCLDKLNRDLLNTCAMCKVPKAWLWIQMLLGRKWTEEKLFKNREHVHQTVWSLVDKYVSGLANNQSAPKFHPAFNFCVPGRVLYYELQHASDQHSPAAASGPPPSAAPHSSREPTRPEHVIVVEHAAGQDTSVSQAQPSQSPGQHKRIWSKDGAAGRNKQFVPHWTSPAAISRAGLLVSKRMFAMHVPDFQAAVLKECL